MHVAQEESRQRSTLAISVISSLAKLLPIEGAEPLYDVLIALTSFTSEQDEWTTHESYTTSTSLLNDFVESSEGSHFWATVESLLKTRIRPIFAKTKNPAITESGRKNFHPIPLPRFDMSILDPETKPWKTYDVYITTVYSWIVNQYEVRVSYVEVVKTTNMNLVYRSRASRSTFLASSSTHSHPDRR